MARPPRPSRRRPLSGRGFTLVEMLMTIAIVAVLGSLLFSSYTKATRLADRTHCVQNLRQIGLALGSYASDHDGALPYIGTSWMGPISKINNSQGATPLAPYLGGDQPTAVAQTIPAFICPAWRKAMGSAASGPSYWSAYLLRRISDNQHVFPYLSPFGKSGASNPSPLTLTQLNSLPDFSPARQWAVQDCDQQNYGSATTAGMAPLPVHVDSRNALFFDFHVEMVPASVLLQ